MTLHHMLHATGGRSSTTRAPFCRHFDPSNGRPLRRLHPNLPCNGCRWSHGGRHGGRSPLFGRGLLAGFAWSPFAPCMNVVERVEIAAVDRRQACNERGRRLPARLHSLPRPQQATGAPRPACRRLPARAAARPTRTPSRARAGCDLVAPDERKEREM